jgi:hypothetical protein
MFVIGQGPAATSPGIAEAEITAPKSEALISLEFEIIAASSGSDEKGKSGEETPEMRILNLQFNSLDFIGKWE